MVSGRIAEPVATPAPELGRLLGRSDHHGRLGNPASVASHCRGEPVAGFGLPYRSWSLSSTTLEATPSRSEPSATPDAGYRWRAELQHLIQGFRSRGGYGSPQPHDLDVMLARLSERLGVAGRTHSLELFAEPGRQLVSSHHHWRRGRERSQDCRKGMGRRSAGWRSASLSSARSNFALGDYETASCPAREAVEVEVRRVAGLPNELLGST